MARTTTTPDLDAIRAKARSDISTALDAARAKHAEHEHAVAPLKAEIEKWRPRWRAWTGRPRRPRAAP
jgi:hypothetical protein